MRAGVYFRVYVCSGKEEEGGVQTKKAVEHLDGGDSSAHKRFEPN